MMRPIYRGLLFREDRMVYGFPFISKSGSFLIRDDGSGMSLLVHGESLTAPTGIMGYVGKGGEKVPQMIFEGDIVARTRSDGDIDKGEVVYEDRRARFTIKGYFYEDWYLDDLDEPLKIIGNIFLHKHKLQR